MDDMMILEIIKARLDRLDTLKDDFILALIQAERKKYDKTGIHLKNTIDDIMLLVDSVVWRYGSRDKQEAMPEWLRIARRERWLSENGDAYHDT